MWSSSYTGRVVFGSVFIVSAWIMFSRFFSDPRYKEEFTSKFAGLLLIGVTDSTKDNIVVFFLTLFVSEQAVGGYMLLVGNREWVYHLGCYLLIATPILFDFYYYKLEEPEFLLLLQGFVQNMAFFGVVLIFMKMEIPMESNESKWTLDLTQPQKYISEKSMTQYHKTSSSPRTCFLPKSNIRSRHTYQLIPCQDQINLPADLLSQQIHESSFRRKHLKDSHKQEEFIRHRILDIYN